jgi:hypothetical protein
VAKREIAARELMDDIRAGMDDTGLMEKYRLTTKQLDSSFRKLLSAGLMSPSELEARKIKDEETVNLSGLFMAFPDESKARSPQKKTRYSFSGRVEDVDILDYIQCMLMEGRRTVLEVRPINGPPCRLFLDAGMVIHAIAGEIEGEEAFYRCVQFRSGEFAHLPWTEPKTATIEKAGTVLLFEAARRRDEADSGLF